MVLRMGLLGLVRADTQCLFAMRRQLQKICVRQFGAQVRRIRDRARTDNPKHPLIVSLVKADAQAPPLNVRQALKILRLDIYRKILSDFENVNHVHLWGFYNSSPKTADVESDVWVTLRSIGVLKPHHICDSQQLQHLENRLSESTSLIVDLSAPEDSDEGACTTVRDFLKTFSVQLLRISALLESDTEMEQAEGALRFYRTFLSAVDDYVMENLALHDATTVSNERDSGMLQLLSEQEAKYHRHMCDFETRMALDVLWETMIILRMHLESDTSRAPSSLVLLAAKERIIGHLANLGITLDTESTQPEADGRTSSIVDAVAAFRREVRSFALQDQRQRSELIAACDGVRDSLLKSGVKLQDKKNQAPWLWALPKK